MKPNNKIDKLLANIGGEEYEVTPQTPREFFLKEIDERVDADEAAIAAANGRIDGINAVPDYAVSDAGKVLTVNTEDVTETVVVAPEQSIRLKTSGATFTVNLVTLAAGDTVTINGELWGDHKLDTLSAVEVELVEEQGELLAIYVGDTYVYTFAIGEGGVASVVNDDTHTTLGDQFSLEHFAITTAVTTTEASAGWNALPTEVPTPAIADAGKAIVVNNSGEYALDNVGGGGVLIIPITKTGGSHAEISVTREEIAAAIEAGKIIYYKVQGMSTGGAITVDPNGIYPATQVYYADKGRLEVRTTSAFWLTAGKAECIRIHLLWTWSVRGQEWEMDATSIDTYAYTLTPAT